MNLWQVLYIVNGREINTTVEARRLEIQDGCLIFLNLYEVPVRVFNRNSWVDVIILAKGEGKE